MVRTFSWSRPVALVHVEQRIHLVGHDATVAFEDVGHSTSARKLADTFYIGELVEVQQILSLLSHWFL